MRAPLASALIVVDVAAQADNRCNNHECITQQLTMIQFLYSSRKIETEIGVPQPRALMFPWRIPTVTLTSKAKFDYGPQPLTSSLLLHWDLLPVEFSNTRFRDELLLFFAVRMELEFLLFVLWLSL
jgi:hypothetical protein